MTADGPILGVAMEHYAHVVGGGIGDADTERTYGRAASLSINRSTWDQASQGWMQRLQEAGEDSPLGRQFRSLLMATLRRDCGELKPLDFESYLASGIAMYTGTPYHEVTASLGYDVKGFTLVGYEWSERLEKDPWLNAYFTLRLQKGVAEKTGQAPRMDLKWVPGTMVRARRCIRCGAAKTTRSRTAYIYCDYCGTLFDYDIHCATEDPTALDSDDVDAVLDGVCVDKLRAAFEAGDQQTYARITTWRTEVCAEICPNAFSPRIKDPDYRQRLIHDVLVPWRIATRFDPAFQQLRRAFGMARDAMLNDPCLATVMNLLHRARQLWAMEADILEARGIMQKHPEGMDREMFLYVTMADFLRGTLQFVRGDEAKTLLEAAGFSDEYIEAPAIDRDRVSCGSCGAPLELPKGAKRTVCEWCGRLLDTETRAAACTQCGAMVALPVDGTPQPQYQCGFCHAYYRL